MREQDAGRVYSSISLAPIEDPYLEDPEGGGWASGPLAYQPIPFSVSGT